MEVLSVVNENFQIQHTTTLFMIQLQEQIEGRAVLLYDQSLGKSFKISVLY